MTPEEENDKLALVIDNLHVRVKRAENRLIESGIRLEDDLGIGPRRFRHMWVVYSPDQALPGSLFFLRKHAIAYAVENLGFSWAKCRRMGYHCDKVYLVPEI